MFSRVRGCLVWAALVAAPATVFGDETLVPIGIAKQDITPDYAVRLSGYGGRRAESAGIEQRIWAKALAIGADADTVILITVDNLGVPNTMARELAARLKA